MPPRITVIFRGQIGSIKRPSSPPRLQTLFICIALAVGAISFSRDADHLLLGPLERILVKLEVREEHMHGPKERIALKRRMYL